MAKTEVTYRCPMPDCIWKTTDTRRETLSGTILLRLAERQGVDTSMVNAGMTDDHDQKLADRIAGHLRSHPELRADPQVPEAAAYIIHQARAQLTDGRERR